MPKPSPTDPTRPAAEDREPLSGLVERVAYHNTENGYCVLRAKLLLLQIGVVASVPRCLVLQP
ncbi:hypothetical protein J2Y49_004091 [Azospirillum sp. BE72]|nr:hypothetical protein [Azospirillum sp. BE72]